MDASRCAFYMVRLDVIRAQETMFDGSVTKISSLSAVVGKDIPVELAGSAGVNVNV